MADLDQKAELLPCPFCGGEIGHRIGKNTLRYVCMICGAEGPTVEANAETPEAWDQARAAWNRRASSLPADGLVLVPRDATADMTADAVRHALSIVIGSEYPWPQYMADLWKIMLAAAPAQALRTRNGVGVKKLEWAEDDEAVTPFGKYRVRRTDDGYALTFEYEEVVHIGFNSVGPFQSPRIEAMSYAQPDFDRRILSALSKEDRR